MASKFLVFFYLWDDDFLYTCYVHTTMLEEITVCNTAHCCTRTCLQFQAVSRYVGCSLVATVRWRSKNDIVSQLILWEPTHGRRSRRSSARHQHSLTNYRLTAVLWDRIFHLSLPTDENGTDLSNRCGCARQIEHCTSGGSRRGDGGPAPPLLLDQTEARRSEKNFLGDRPLPPPPLSQGLDPAPICKNTLQLSVHITSWILLHKL